MQQIYFFTLNLNSTGHNLVGSMNGALNMKVLKLVGSLQQVANSVQNLKYKCCAPCLLGPQTVALELSGSAQQVTDSL